MSIYSANISWVRSPEEAFTDLRYSRAHTWRFDGGAEIAASPSPHIVPVPLSVAEYVDPEEAFIAALASCHMLFFLSFAARRNFVVDNYVDAAEGVMERNERGRMAMTRVVLHPRVTYAGTRPTKEEEAGLHHRAHEECFLANSVMTQIDIQLA